MDSLEIRNIFVGPVEVEESGMGKDEVFSC